MKKLLLPLLSIMLSTSLHAHGDFVHTDAHEHGVADVVVLWEDDKLTFTVAVPAQDMVGFEHMPKGAKEKRLVRDADQHFANNLFFNATGCALHEISVSSILFDNHPEEEESKGILGSLFGKKDKAKEAEAKEATPEHMDFEGFYRAICDDNRSTITFTAFSFLPSLKRVRVHYGTMDAEVSQVLTPEDAVIKPIKSKK